MPIRFVTGEAAAMLPGNVLVVADLHIGAEYEMRRAGLSMPSQTNRLLERTLSLVRNTGAKRLIILGDIKHRVPGLSFQEEREVPRFLSKVNREVHVEIVPGNHDAGLEKLVPELRFHPSHGLLYRDYYLLHGNTWPSESFAKAKEVLIGHNHPLVEFRDKLGYVWREKIWVRARLDPGRIRERFSSAGDELPDLVIMPTYNDISGGVALNSEKRPSLMGPLGRAAQPSTAGAYLLDGTYLGEIGKI